MLRRFSFCNFKSYNDFTELNLLPSKINEYDNNLINIGKESVLPVVAIIGANASGKSNVFNAFSCMSRFVINSLAFADDEKVYQANRPSPYVLNDINTLVNTEFEVELLINEDDKMVFYKYGFGLNKKGVSFEGLYKRTRYAKVWKTIFIRDDKGLDLAGFTRSDRVSLEKAIERRVLLVSVGAKLKVDICQKIREWFRKNACVNFADPVQNFMMEHTISERFVKDANIRASVVNFIGAFDKQIKDFKIEKITANGSEEEKYKITTIHNMNDSDKNVEIPFHEESSGTLKMFSMYPVIDKVMKRGSVFFADELCAKLHPLLLKKIIELFLNPVINTKHAQLIFTTHDILQMSISSLRRDQIWFTDKDVNGASKLYSLASVTGHNGVKIRKDENFVKNYLEGKYKAVPVLDELLYR